MRLVVGIVLHTLVDFFLSALAYFIHVNRARAVKVFGIAQHAVAHELRRQPAFERVIKTDLVFT